MLHLLAFLFLFHSHLTTFTKMVDKVSSSVIRITGVEEEGHFTCTGFVIAANRVLTAGHCAGAEMNADGQAATILKVDEMNDLMLLQVSTAKHALQLRTSPLVRFEEVTSIGYGFGWTQLTVLHNDVMLVTHIPAMGIAPGIITQTEYIGGMSGGPVVDSHGRVIGMVQRGGRGTGYGVGTLIMRAFLLGT